ncbi:DUF927 domain-containing protein [Flavobacterium sp.]|jgi:putative DNA primase/helicase|uniref:DUF927 domain-containing protein n=1 Tax=Flavobacterium sp. TaxID=239 RepID=UPI0037BF12B2
MNNGEFFRRVSEAALIRFDSVMGWLGLDGGKHSGPEYLPLNPRRGDHTPGSFSINKATGKWSDFADDAKGGDLVSLVAYLQGLKQLAAADALADYLGLPARPGRTDAQNRATAPANYTANVSVSGTAKETRHGGTQKASEPAAVCVMPVPDDAPLPPKAHSRHGAPTARYAYHDDAGRVNYYHDRYEPKGVRKQFSPLTLWRLPGGDVQWQFKAPPDPRPVYGLDLLAAKPDAQVVIVEGEKARTAAETLLPDAVVICWQGGAQAVAKTDWRALQGRAVILWPDADDPGKTCMDKLATILHGVGVARLYRVRLDRLALDAITKDGTHALATGALLANGDDAADMVARGWTAEHMALIWPKAGAAIDPDSVLEALAAPPAKRRQDYATNDAQPTTGNSTPTRFALNEHGLYYTEPEKAPRWVCQHVEVIARARDPHGAGWGKLVAFHNPDKQEIRQVIPDAMLAGDGMELEKFFRGHGFDLAPTGRQLFRQYLIESNPEARLRIVTATGWHRAGNAEPVYVLPGETFGKNAEPWLYDVGGDAPKHFATRGTLAEWRDNVAALCVGNSRLVFAVSAAFAAPLLYLTKDESGGFHVSGNSSDGKTSTLVAASSVAGPPREYLQRWRTTDNSLEGLAARYCDALLPLDDLGQSDAKTVGQSIYMLSNESGKARMNDRAAMRATAKWRLLFMSTGELGLADRMGEAGQKPRAGQELRMAEVPADAGADMGVFENIHGTTTPELFARRVTESAGKYYGTALRAWLQKLADCEHDGLAEQVEAAAKLFIEAHLTSEAHGQAKRVARRFALVGAAGEIATTFGITGWERGEAIKAAGRCYKDWLGKRGGEADQEQRAMLQQVRGFLEQHAESRFTSTARSEIDEKHAPRTAYRAGFRRPISTATGQAWEYLVLPSVWRTDVCKGYDPVAVARLMKARGWMIGSAEKDRAPRVKIDVDGQGRQWVHHITHEFLEADL